MYAAPFRTGTPEPEVMPMSAEKIGPQHRARKAVLYIRQSSAHQVQHNRESQGLQYAMRERLAQLGFTQVEVIDEDLGCSAADGTLRAGFERLLQHRAHQLAQPLRVSLEQRLGGDNGWLTLDLGHGGAPLGRWRRQTPPTCHDHPVRPICRTSRTLPFLDGRAGRRRGELTCSSPPG